jgi:ABC-2 type transport system permease protein
VRVLTYALMRAKVRLAYRIDFLVGAIGEGLVASIGIVFLWAVFRNVPSIRGWLFHEVFFVWGMAETATGLFFVLFQGLWVLNQRYLLQGELDRVLLRPLDPYLQVLLDNLNPEDGSVVLVGIAMIAIGAPALSAFEIAHLAVAIASGTLVLGGLLTLVSAVGFRVHHRGTAIGLVYQGAVFGRYPLDLFHHWLRLVLTWVVPFAFLAYYPATHFLGRPEHATLAAIQPLVGVGMMALGYGVWMRALRSYRSPGS